MAEIRIDPRCALTKDDYEKMHANLPVPPDPREHSRRQIEDTLARTAAAFAMLGLSVEEVAEDWMAEARCREMDPEIFSPSDGRGVIKAQKICNGVDDDPCPVREQCLEYALKYKIDFGIWGGKSERQRRAILRKRRLEARSAAPVE